MATSSGRSRRPKTLTDPEIYTLLDEIPEGSDDERLADDDDEVADPDFELRHLNDDETDSEQEGSDEAEGDEEVMEPGPSSSKRQRTEAGPQRIYHWVKKDLPPHVNPPNRLVAIGTAAEAQTVLQMFSSHFEDDSFEQLTLESNRYMRQLGRTKCKSVDVREMRTMIGICFFMSVVCLPNRRMYWSPGTRQAQVADAMTLNRFEEILSVFHINDNELMRNVGDPHFDRLHKVRPLIKVVQDAFKSCAEPETFVSVDEQMIPFKGRHSLKCYMMKKPKKWGYKVWVQAGRSGYVHHFELAGDNTIQTPKDIKLPVGKPGEVVIRLTGDQPQGSYVFFDNYFSCPELLIEMKRRGLHATSTIRPNRSRKCPLMCIKDLKKKGRGTYDYRCDKDESFIICNWFDNKIVHVASNVHGVEPANLVRRYDRSTKEYRNVTCPSLIKSYNESMGGVDKCDMLLELYRNDHKSKKWYKRIMFHLLDLCVVNSWILYRTVKNDCRISLCSFKLALARSLIECETPHASRVIASARDVNEDSRYDRVDHFPGRDRQASFPQRCKLTGCTRKSQYKCRKCGVVLCISSKGDGEDCFYLFHHR